MSDPATHKDTVERESEAPPPRKSNAGRPTSYNPEYVKTAKKLAQFGATDAEMAEFFEVAQSTFYLWKATHKEFSEAVSMAKVAFDDRIERSLAMRAVGYDHDEEKVFFPAGSKEPVKVTVRKHYTGSDTAAIFWLKNRRPELWRDRQELAIGRTEDLQTIPTDQLEAMVLENMKDVTPAEDQGSN